MQEQREKEIPYPPRASPEGRVPPYDHEAELAILGSILIDNTVLQRVRTILSPEDFYGEACRRIYEAILGIAAEGRPIDAVILGSAMRTKGELERIGGARAIASLTDAVVTAVHAEHYAGIVRRKAIVRRMIYVAQEIVAEGFTDPGDSTDAYLERARSTIIHASLQGVGSRSVARTIDEDLSTIWKEITEGVPMAGLVKTGIATLDALVGGLFPGKIVTIGARPGMGKSMLALNIADNVCKPDAPVLLILLEDPLRTVTERLLARHADIDAHDIHVRDVLPERYPMLLNAVNRLSNRPLYVDARSRLTRADVAASIHACADQHGLSLVIVDHVMEIKEDMEEDYTRQIAQAAEGVRDAIRDLNIPGILVAQLNRGVEARPNKRPLLSDIRQSGRIEELSRAVWFLYRQGYYDRNAESHTIELDIAKNNDGPVGMVPLWCDPSRMYVRGWEPQQDGPFHEANRKERDNGDENNGGRPPY